jgi:HEAT repeat protein
MTRRKASAKSDAAGLLERLSPEEAVAVLHQLFDKHPELRPEAEQVATKLVSSFSIEDIAEDVHYRVTSIDLDDLNGRAGAHSWGYVGPDQAAQDLLEEALEDLVEDMKRRAELGLVSAAEAVCAGIVQGLYQARDTKSDGALGWAPDFPGEESDYVVGEFLRACPPATRKAAQKSLMESLAKRAPRWVEDLKRAADRSNKE